MIGHCGLLRAFSSIARWGVLGMSRGSIPRHAQAAGDLCFAMQFNAETFRTAPLSSDRIVPRVTIGRVTLFIPHEKLYVKHTIAGFLRLPRPTPVYMN